MTGPKHVNSRNSSTTLPTSGRTLGAALRILNVLLLVAVLGGVYLASPSSPVPPDELAPVSAGVPLPGTPLFSESFSHQSATASAIDISAYSGANGMSYSADAPYLPAAGQCNGWVMGPLSPQPTAAQDAGCANNAPAGWNSLKDMAVALGTVQGQDAATAATNQVLTEYTNSANGAIAAGYELKTNAAIAAVPGHYYAVSAYFAEISCFAAHASLTFSLVINGAPKPLSSGLDPCTAPGVQRFGPVRVVKLQSAAIQMPAGVSDLGLQVYNATATGSGNDAAFDLPEIVDVTPTVDKVFSPSTIVQGETSTLTLTVTNTDDLKAKTDWDLKDTLPAGMTLASSTLGGTCAQVTGAAFVKTGSVGGNVINVTGGDLADGDVSCTITATVTTDSPGTFVNGPKNVTTNLNPPTDTPLTVVPPVAKLALDKRVVSPNGVVDVNGNGVTDAGDTITYEFELKNTGNVTLTSANVTDPKLAAAGLTISCPAASLVPGGSTVCTTSGPYTIKQSDVDTGAVTNIATGHGTPPPGVTPPIEPTDSTVTPTATAASIDLVKVADRTALVAGQTITYTFTATNTGAVSLADVTISETSFDGSGAMSPLSCTPTQPATLAPAKQLVCTATYVVTQADVDAGIVRNTATVIGTPPTGPPLTDTDQAQVPGTRAGSLLLDKRVVSPNGVVDVNSNAVTDAGDTIKYEFELTNNGNVTLTNVSATDPKLAAAGITISCPVTTLAPDESATCTASGPYTITQSDVDSGAVVNVATGHGTPPPGTPAVDPPTDTTVTPTGTTASIDLVKTADTSTLVAGVGHVITYTFTATNTGSVTLHDVTISEKTFSGSGSLSGLTCSPNQPAILAPAKALVCSATYAVTQADVDAGTISNSAHVVGTPPTGPYVSDDDQVQIPGVRYTHLFLDKRVVTPGGVVDVNGNGLTDAGDTIAYEFQLANHSNVTLRNLNVTDPKLAAAGITITCPVTTLAPGESTVCTASDPYTITQADVDAGAVTNVATGHGTPPAGVDPPQEPTDSTITPTDIRSGLLLDKRVSKVTDANGNGITDVGDTIAYEFEVTNTGTTTLDDLSVNDPLAGAVTCPVTTLAAGRSTVCVADAAYVITQADVDAGNVHNRATASGNGSCAGPGGGGGQPGGGDTGPPGGRVVGRALSAVLLSTVACVVDSNPDTTDTPTEQLPGVAFDKRVAKKVDVDRDGYLDLGDEIYYEFLVKNTGNVTLTDVVVQDDLLSHAHLTVTCTPDTLAPGESVVCKPSGPYKITAADVAEGVVVNAALVHVEVPPGVPSVDPPKDHTTTPTGSFVDPPLEVHHNLPETGLSTLVLFAGGAGLLMILAGIVAIRAASRRQPAHAK